MVTNIVLITQDQGIAISQYAPVSAQLPSEIGGGADITMTTNYPFGDTVSIEVNVKSKNTMPLYFRVPTWATSATATVNDGNPMKLTNGMMQKITCDGNNVTKLEIDFNPTVRVELGWGYNNSVAVVRGPLVYALYMEENFATTRHYAFNSNDYVVSSTTAWNYALLIDTTRPENTLTFQRNGDPGAIPFNNKDFSQVIHAKGRRLPSWIEVTNAAAAPPPSPVMCNQEGAEYSPDAIDCGPVTDLLLVPYGCTDLRMGSLPWIRSP